MAVNHKKNTNICVKELGLVRYETSLRAMQEFTSRRDYETPDELWVLEHPSTYTLGQSGRSENLLKEEKLKIPIVKSDRGGQITYHGPGQLIIYTLLDLRRRTGSVRTLVRNLEQAMIQVLDRYDVKAHGSESRPGVYVNNAKIGALGLRIKGGCCYHGLALNVNMDLKPFANINPCGYPGLGVTQLLSLGITDKVADVGKKLIEEINLVL